MKQAYLIALEAAIEAGKAILEIYDSSSDIEITSKTDDSPLTNADKASNKVINSYLEQTDFPIISEENRQIDFSERGNWESCWIVDPLDGTKEFIKRNGEFTVNIAWCKSGKPEFGVIYVPVTRELYYAEVNSGKAYKSTLDSGHSLKTELFSEADRILPSDDSSKELRVVGSRSHMNADTEAFIEEMKESYDEITIVSKGSSLKFCLVAEGRADVYPRFAPTMEWDTAAGSAICEAVGLSVISQQDQQPLRYNKQNLLNPYFLVQANVG